MDEDSSLSLLQENEKLVKVQQTINERCDAMTKDMTEMRDEIKKIK